MHYCLHCHQSFNGRSHDDPCPACGTTPGRLDGVPCYAPALAHESSGFRPERYARLAQLEEGNFWFRARNELIVYMLRKYFPQARNMLEIGCGTGYVLRGITRSIPHLHVHGSELFLQGLKFATQRLPNADLFQMDARDIPYESEFDLIGAFDVMEHIEEDEVVLRQVHRALVPGGGAVFSVPQHPALWSARDESACHVRRYRRHELEGKLRANGFRVVFSTSFVSLLLPLLAISRWRKQRPADSAEVDSEFMPAPLLNSVLYHVLRLESLLIRSGLRFPAGGTRLVATVKTV